MCYFIFAVLFGLGDVIAQFVVKKEGDKFDFPRLGRAWVFGTFILGPLGHLHYNFIEWLTVHKVCLTVSQTHHTAGSYVYRKNYADSEVTIGT